MSRGKGREKELPQAANLAFFFVCSEEELQSSHSDTSSTTSVHVLYSPLLFKFPPLVVPLAISRHHLHIVMYPV